MLARQGYTECKYIERARHKSKQYNITRQQHIVQPTKVVAVLI